MKNIIILSLLLLVSYGLSAQDQPSQKEKPVKEKKEKKEKPEKDGSNKENPGQQNPSKEKKPNKEKQEGKDENSNNPSDSTQKKEPGKARFPGGQQAMVNYIADNLSYPEEARANGVQGKVVVAFYVLEDGSLDSIHVVNEAKPMLIEPALQVIRSMPNWEPAMVNGVPVKRRVTVPIKFTLNNKKPKKKTKSD